MKTGKKICFKKWMNLLITNDDQKIFNYEYGCFEMIKVDGILKSLLLKKNSFSLCMLFEILISKVVASHVGNIIFTDDHLSNIGYITVNYGRQYNIISNGKKYSFFAHDEKLIQFIDLERYVFNFSDQRIYLNKLLKLYSNNSDNVVEKLYNINNYIFDKSINNISKLSINTFKDTNEFNITHDILSSSFFGTIDNFCELMDKYLPDNNKNPIEGKIYNTYNINIDCVHSTA
jgi:hypothetical protein